jgi:hypothetical protein
LQFNSHLLFNKRQEYTGHHSRFRNVDIDVDKTAGVPRTSSAPRIESVCVNTILSPFPLRSARQVFWRNLSYVSMTRLLWCAYYFFPLLHIAESTPILRERKGLSKGYHELPSRTKFYWLFQARNAWTCLSTANKFYNSFKLACILHCQGPHRILTAAFSWRGSPS